MQDRLIERLNSYIIEDHPDLVLRLCENGGLQSWLLNRVSSALPLIGQLSAAGKSERMIEEAVLDAMTKDLRPSKFHYLAALMEEDFAFHFYRMRESGTLTAFITGMIICCEEPFRRFGFCEENENNLQIRKAIGVVLRARLENGGSR